MAPSSSASNSAFKPIRDAVDRAEALHSDEEDSAGARAKQPRLSQDGGDAEGAGAMDEDRNRGWEGEGGEAGYHPVDQIESLCMECHEQGTTRLLLTMIPYFKEVIIMSFRCPHCGCTNTEIQSAGQIQELGSAHTVKLTTREDLNRQLVKSAYATLTIPEYELTLPPGKGQLTTIESIISHTIEDIGFDQPARKHLDPTNYEKIEAVLDRLRAIVAEGQEAKENLDKPFTVKLEDPSGNSFIEAKGGFGDPKWSMRAFRRTMEQNEALGLAKAETGQGAEAAGTGSGPVLARPSRNQAAAALAEKTLTDDYVADKPDEVLSFPDICSSCGATLETYMKTVDIPHFKEVVLMSTNCHSCGYRDNEIKSGGAIAAKGRKITLRVEDSEDLSRDILKSETAGLSIPDIDLDLHPGTLGGRFTTLEGLLNQVYEELDEKVFAGDSAAAPAAGSSGSVSTMEAFMLRLKGVMEAAHPFTVVLDDPLSNSYIQNIYAPDDDPNMRVEEYERDHEQNEELGLNDIQVEGYHGEEEARKAREEDDARMEATATATA